MDGFTFGAKTLITHVVCQSSEKTLYTDTLIIHTMLHYSFVHHAKLVVDPKISRQCADSLLVFNLSLHGLEHPLGGKNFGRSRPSFKQ